MSEDAIGNEIRKALDDLDEWYCHDSDGVVIPTTCITDPTGALVTKFPRGSQTPAEVQRLVDQFNQIHELPEAGSR